MPQRLLKAAPLARVALISTAALLATPMAARAQSNSQTVSPGAAALESAAAAYLDVNFEGTRDFALEALQAGGHAPPQLVRIYQLLGIASSALGENDVARDYFVRMLGVDPDAELDGSVPPRLRTPYMEARGVWAATPARLEASVGLDRANSAIGVRLTDPMTLASRVRVSARLEGAAQYESGEFEAASLVRAPLEGAAEADRVEYHVEVLDEYGNTVLKIGDAFSPAIVGRERGPTGGGSGEPSGGGSVFEEPWLYVVVGLVAVAGGAVAAGIILDQQSRIGAQTGISIGID